MLSVQGLTRYFGELTVLDQFALDVPTGKVACLVGPSGCGKSTILRLVAGIDTPDGGDIRLGERHLSGPGWALEPRRRGLNMVFQDYALWPHMRVAEIVGYGLRHLSRADRDARVLALLDRLRITALADRLPAQISGGQQQRVAIARALATDPELLLFDEPLSNLDVQLRIEMRLEFADLFAEVGKTVLYVTHDPLEACSFADTLVVMQAGRIVQSGAPDALFLRPRSVWIATLAGYDTRLPARLIAREGEHAEVEIAGQRLRVLAPDPEMTLGSGDAATVMLHPAAAVNDPPPEMPRLTGTVVRALFEGRDWRITLALGEARATILSPVRVAPGTDLSIGVPEGAALVFAPDKRT